MSGATSAKPSVWKLAQEVQRTLNFDLKQIARELGIEEYV